MANAHIRRNWIIGLLVFFCVILIFKISTAYHANLHTPAAIADYIPSAYGNFPQSKNAFAVFLNSNSNSKTPDPYRRGDSFPDEDHYFNGTRMLLYQLLHDPDTRTNTSIPFVVLVSKDVSAENRAQLRSEGAIVKEVDEVVVPWIKPGRDRWAHVMDKLHVFELIEYDKVLLLDSDIVVTQRIDAIFDDPATKITHNLGKKENVREDEAPQPSTYIMAGNSGPNFANHPYPSPRGDRLNAGFVLLKPSIEMYNHYVSVCAIEGRFRGSSSEQDLWNCVHNRNGNMPWTQLDPDWIINAPNYNDYLKGVKTFHEKYWSYKT